MKHKYAEIIKSKVDNMQLVLLIKVNGEWKESAFIFPGGENASYFLCHPKHVNETIHWLNGGEVLVGYKHFDYQAYEGDESIAWRAGLWCMRDDFESRIKRKKEKRWIVVNTSDEVTMTCCQTGTKINSCSHAYLDEAGANYMASKYGGQPIEIEVEVD